jgi:hypothetical protein
MVPVGIHITAMRGISGSKSAKGNGIVDKI